MPHAASAGSVGAGPRSGPHGRYELLLVALLVVPGLVYCGRHSVKAVLVDWFGPPVVRMSEAYETDPQGPEFDHSVLDGLLHRHVDDAGWVDYEGLRGEQGQLDRYLESVAGAPFDQLGRDEKLALLINAYNAFTLRLIIDYAPVKSIRDIPTGHRWKDERWVIGGRTLSLDQIEHEQIRPRFEDARVHFALNCAAIGCPPLRNEAYVADRLDAQLHDQARYVHTHDRWFRFDPATEVVHLTRIYEWYDGDFRQVAGSVLAFAARYAPALGAALEAGRPPRVRWLDYDWSLNSVEHRIPTDAIGAAGRRRLTPGAAGRKRSVPAPG